MTSFGIFTPEQRDQEARRILADALDREAVEHEAGRYKHLAECYDEVLGELLPLVDTDKPPFQVGLYFLDSWGDASQHEWEFYDGISRDDWPRHARQIAEAVRLRNPITEPVLLRHFGPRAPSWPSKWLRRLLGFVRPSA